MSWKTDLRDLLISKIQPTGLTVYLVHHNWDGGRKKQWQEDLRVALTTAGINVVKATWDLDTYADRGILLMLRGDDIIKTQRFRDVIGKATSIKWLINVFSMGPHTIKYLDSELGFKQVQVIRKKNPDMAVRTHIFKRVKADV